MYFADKLQKQTILPEIVRFLKFFGEISVVVYLIFYKLIFFGTLIIFLEPTIKLITRTFDLSKVTVILIMTAQVLFSNVVFKKDLHLNTVEFTIIFEK